MKNLLYNISLFAFLAFTAACTHSCSYDLQEIADVEVGFTATLPSGLNTRSSGSADYVNTLVVGVFNNSKEEIDRKEFIIDGTAANVSLLLARNQTYSFIFWAYDKNLNAYNIEDLTAIRMKSLPESVTFGQVESSDVFFATKEDVAIEGSGNWHVELIRPLAQINVGTAGKVMHASFSIKSAPDTFYPFKNCVGGKTDFTWNFSETSSATFNADGKQYNYLAMGYLFAPAEAMRVAAKLTLTDGNNSNTLDFPQMLIEANSRSNIAGGFTAE